MISYGPRMGRRCPRTSRFNKSAQLCLVKCPMGQKKARGRLLCVPKTAREAARGLGLGAGNVRPNRYPQRARRRPARFDE